MLVCVQVGGVDPKQLAVYEEFARNIPGFLPSNDLSQPTGFLAQPMKVSLFSVTTVLISRIRETRTENCSLNACGFYAMNLFYGVYLRLGFHLFILATGMGH